MAVSIREYCFVNNIALLVNIGVAAMQDCFSHLVVTVQKILLCLQHKQPHLYCTISNHLTITKSFHELAQSAGDTCL